MWYYESSIGMLSIYPKSGRYALKINDEVYGSYHTPSAAVSDVYNHVTGCTEWDMLITEDAPSDLNEWFQQ